MARITWLHAEKPSVDFYFFWDAAGRVLRGGAAQAYLTHATPVETLSPLAHPPTFLLLTAPLGVLPYGSSLVLWLTLTGLLCFFASRQPLRLWLINPPTACNVLFGQAGFLTGALFLGGANQLDRRPLLAGALLGLLTVKPHLALLLPVALVAGRKWIPLATAAGSAAVLTALAAVVFGTDIYRAWWLVIAQYWSWLAGGFWRWSLLASPYGLLRWVGANHQAALAAQLLAAAAAAIVVFKAWHEDWESRVAVLASAALLVPPYLFTYDAVILIVPLGWLAKRDGWRVLAVWLLLLVALLGTTFLSTSVLPLSTGYLPNTTSLAAALSLVFLCLEQRQVS